MGDVSARFAPKNSQYLVLGRSIVLHQGGGWWHRVAVGNAQYGSKATPHARCQRCREKRTPFIPENACRAGQALRSMEHHNKVSSRFRDKNYSTVLLGMDSTFRVFIDTTIILIVAPPRARRATAHHRIDRHARKSSTLHRHRTSKSLKSHSAAQARTAVSASAPEHISLTGIVYAKTQHLVGECNQTINKRKLLQYTVCYQVRAILKTGYDTIMRKNQLKTINIRARNNRQCTCLL